MTFQGKITKAKELIREYTKKYPCYGVACSWGKDSMVLLDLFLGETYPEKPKVFSVLSDTEFLTTLNLRDKILGKWQIEYKEFIFKQSEEVDDCCRTAKVAKFQEGIKDIDCWFSGLRQDEGVTRRGLDFVIEHDRFNKVKVNPLLDFTEKDIWRYSAVYQVPVNALYSEYRSLSCSKCSFKEEDENESERAGRWKGTSNEGGECGIHKL